MKNIYAVIVTFNSMKWIDKCISSLKNSSVYVNIIIVDNNSGDNTVEHIKNNYPQVFLVNSKENYGFGKANNIGIKYAMNNDAEYILLINQDAWIQRDSIKIMIDQNLNDSIISPIHLNGRGDLLDYNFRKSILKNAYNNYLLDNLFFDNKHNANYEVDFVNAACWLIPVNIINEIGGFNPLFFHYGEDVNYCQRLHYHKYKIVVNINSFVCHDRELFGNKSLFNKNIIKRSLIINCANINKPMFNFNKNNLIFHSKTLLRFIFSLFTLNFKFCYNIIQAYTTIVLKLNTIHRYRIIDKKKGMNWL